MNLPINNTFTADPVSASVQQLLDQLALCRYEETALLKTINKLNAAYPLHLDDFPLIENSYSRTILHQDESGFEAIIVRWDKGVISSIHGHPQFTFVYLLHGALNIEQFEKQDNLAIKQNTTCYQTGQHFYAKGHAGQFDNAIHRILTTEPSLSLHIYSDNALKGEVFS